MRRDHVSCKVAAPADSVKDAHHKIRYAFQIESFGTRPCYSFQYTIVLTRTSRLQKKLLYMYYEICPKLDSNGKLKQEMILVWYVEEGSIES